MYFLLIEETIYRFRIYIKKKKGLHYLHITYWLQVDNHIINTIYNTPLGCLPINVATKKPCLENPVGQNLNEGEKSGTTFMEH